jgi:Tfp pilus assembly protein PilO
MSTIRIANQDIPALYIAIALPAIALVYAFMAFTGEGGIMPRNDELTTREAGLETKKQEVEQLKLKAARLPKLKEEVANLDAQITLLRAKIPGTAQVPVLLYDVERITKSSHNLLKTFKPKPLEAFSAISSAAGAGAAAATPPAGAEAVAGIQQLPIDIHAEGAYPEIISMLDGIANYERKLNVTNLSLTPLNSGNLVEDKKGGLGYKNTLSLDFTLTAYVLPNKTPDAGSSQQ